MAARLERLREPAAFLSQLRRELDALAIRSEIIAVPAGPNGYGHELRSGLRRARGAYVITVDPDFSGPMSFLTDLWSRRRDAWRSVRNGGSSGRRAPMATSAPTRCSPATQRPGRC